MAEEIQRLLECSMCLELFDSSVRWPKLLPCQHTLCLECLDMLNQGGKIQCPQCRVEHACPPAGPKHLPNNFTMLALLDVQQKAGSSSSSTSAKELPPPAPPKVDAPQPPAINEGIRNSIALLAKKLQEKSVELSSIDKKEKATEEMLLSVKNQVDSAFEARTRELKARRDQLIKQLASARQEELSFLQGQRASAYHYLQRLQQDFSKMRQALLTSSQPREADLINLLSLCRGYLSQIEHYALNIDQRICNVAFSDPNQQQLSISIQAYGCLSISTDKTKSVQALRPLSSLSESQSVLQSQQASSSASNPFPSSVTRPETVSNVSSTTSVTSSSSATSTPALHAAASNPVLASSQMVSTARQLNGTSPVTNVSAANSPASTPTSLALSSTDERVAVARQQSMQSRRLSEPASMFHSAPTHPAAPSQPFQAANGSNLHPRSSISQPTPSNGVPTASQATRHPTVLRHLSLDSLTTSLPSPVTSTQPNPAGGDQAPPIPRRPVSVRLGPIAEQPRREHRSSLLVRQHSASSASDVHGRGEPPPLPPRRNVQIPDTDSIASAAAVPSTSASVTNGSSARQSWVTFDTLARQGSKQTQNKRVTVIGQLFEKPTGVHVLERLNNCLAVTDERQHCIMIVNEEGKLLSRMGTPGNGVGQLQFPKGVCSNNAGQLIVTDWWNHRVQIWDLRGQIIKQFGSRGQSSSQFNSPLGVICDKLDNIYVCDYSNGCVKVFNPEGQFLRQIGKRGDRDGQFQTPSNIAFTQGGELLVTDTTRHCVQVFSTQGTYLYRFGSWGTGSGQLNCPRGIVADAQGYMYVANSGNHRVEVFNPSGSYAMSFGRHGSEDGLFDEPFGISALKDGRIIVSDSANKRLQLVWP